MGWTLEPIFLAPTRESLSPAVPTFLHPIHPYFFLAFPLHRTLVHRNRFFSQALHSNHLKNISKKQSSHLIPPTYHFSLNQHKNIIMVDQLPLAKLSIQNKMCPPARNMQPIKTKKAHPSTPTMLRHPCSLDTLPSPTNKWSAMTHPYGLLLWDSMA
jgi:hypothetical protein